MKLKLSLVTAGDVDDILVTVDATATVGELAERLRVSSPRPQPAAAAGHALSLRVARPGESERLLAPDTTMQDAGIRSGDQIALAASGGNTATGAQAAATLTVLAGPEAGHSFSLPAGTSYVGRDRDCDVRLSDPLVSKRHAKLLVSDMVEVVDDNSANGVLVGGEYAQRSVLRPTDRVTIGDTEFSVALHRAAAAADGSSAIEFNRSPRLDPYFEGIELVAPEPPQPPGHQRFPLITVLSPLLMGAVIYAITRNLLSILFVGLAPVMAIGAFVEGRYAAKKGLETATRNFRSALRDLAVQMQYALDLERQHRRREQPAVDEVVQAVASLTPLVWTRRTEHRSFGHVRLGLGTQASRNSIELPTRNNTVPELWRELLDVVGRFEQVDRVPVVADPADCGNIGVAGPAAAAHPMAASVVAQLVGLHSPAELVLGAITSTESSERWTWLKWLPHTTSEHSPIPADHLARSAKQAAELISALEDVVDHRRSDDDGGDRPTPTPLVVVVVEDDAAIERSRLVQIAERGPAVGVHLVWCATALERLPAACRSFVQIDPNTGAAVAGMVRTGAAVTDLEPDLVAPAAVAQLGRRLAAVVDAGAPTLDQSDLPRTVPFLTVTGPALADQPDEVIEYWRGSHSLPPAPGEGRLKRDATLRAVVGQAATDRFYLDLRTHGPHALVGGTTGAGKSEFLQSWILGMATAHSPARVNFLFVDYKGGAAFADCVDLPHCVGLVTDLSPHLVRRALRSLNAELRTREHLLQRKKAKDLLELERRRDPETPPSLVIVVDEFAALVTDVPEFVDGVVNVAQRGRSLGLHLVLATQRPAGVIKGNLRANTNLRVALRMADEDDSTDVIGSPIAGTFDPGIPGRAIAKTGPGRLTSFQSAYVGGVTSAKPPPPIIEVEEYWFGRGRPWDVPEWATPAVEEEAGASDIRRVVDNVRAANDRIGIPAPRRPWLPELATTYRLEDLPTDRTDHRLVFGVVDQPDDQLQPVVAFEPDRDGNMAVFGTGGAGKSVTLRTLAVAAGFAPARGGPCHVYGLDFGARGLQMLETLPHVGAIINGDDRERTIRLIRTLRGILDDRSERFAANSASTIVEYRERTGDVEEPRILFLVDGFGAFRSAYEVGVDSWVFDAFLSIAADGRGLGVHVLVSADRPSTVPASLSSAIQKRLVLRLGNEMDYSVVGVAADALTASSPPGRGFLDDAEVQVSVLGGESNVARQATATARLAAAMGRAGVSTAAPIPSLPDWIAASDLGRPADGGALLGVSDDTMAAIGFEPTGTFLVSGPPQSGKTTTLATMVRSIREISPQRPFALFGSRRSPLGSTYSWEHEASTPDDMDRLAQELTRLVDREAPEVAGLVVVIESIADVLNGLADLSLQELLKALRGADGYVIAEGESSTLASSWPLLQAVKSSRAGLALQPEQVEGDGIFKTPFPRVRRSDFPPGRGLLVRSGRAVKVQVAVPE